MNRDTLMEIGGQYYWRTLPDAGDMLAALINFGAAAGACLVVWQAVLLLHRKPQQRRWILSSVVLIISGAGYVLLYGMEAPSILQLAQRPGGDVPVLALIKVACLDVMLLALAGILNGATRPVKGEVP